MIQETHSKGEVVHIDISVTARSNYASAVFIYLFINPHQQSESIFKVHK